MLIMSTPHLSRYPRPLKATRAFSGGCRGRDGAGAAEQFASGGGSRRSLSPPSFSSCGLPSTGNAGCSSEGVWSEDISTPTSVEARIDSECGDKEFLPAAKAACLNEEKNCEVACHYSSPRRSSSMGSLTVPECYWSTGWLNDPSPHEQEPEEVSKKDVVPDNCLDHDYFSHKRSSSCSSTDRLRIARESLGFKSSEVGSALTRISVEGLNQEVSSALEGNPTHLIEATPTDGRAAPVRDLLHKGSRGVLTPPTSSSGVSYTITTGPSHSPHSLSVSSLSPHPLPSSPSSISSSSLLMDWHHHGGSNPNIGSPSHLYLPPSPKPSFAHDPPDGVERCDIKMESIISTEGLVLQGPDKSKGTIIFKGNAFSPLVV